MFNLDISGPGLLGQKTNIYLGLPPFESFIGREGIINIPSNDFKNTLKTLKTPSHDSFSFVSLREKKPGWDPSVKGD